MKTDLERFEEKYIKLDNNCWIWRAGSTGRYGWFHFPSYPSNCGRGVASHKASLFLYKGLVVLNKNEEVLHSCDNGLCVNPEHLSIGTHSQNMQDMVSKGRNVIPNQKLDNADIIYARQMRKSGAQVKEIAEYFDISASQMSRLTSGVLAKWKRNAWA